MPMYFVADVGAEWYVHLPQDIKTNYARLTDAFLEEYRPKPAQCWESENALRARSQKPGEDLRSFIKVVRREGNRIGLTDDQLVSIVMNNLLPSIRALIPGTPTTLTTILDTPVGRGDVQVASTGGIDHSQYQQLFGMLLKQNATISSLEAQVMAANAGGGRQDQHNNHPQQRQQGYQQQGYQRYGARQHQPQNRNHGNMGHHQRGQHGQDHRQQQSRQPCGSCGGECQDRFNCMAYGSICSYCKKTNHWAKVCRKRLSDQLSSHRFQNSQR